MKQAVKLLDKEWNLGKKESGTTSDICAWIYLMDVLKETKQLVYYRKNGKLLGFGGYSKSNSKKHKFKKKFYSFIKKRLYKSKKIKNINGLYEYENNYDYMPIEMKNKFDGEVSMLIIDKSLRGKGIGKKLLSDVFKLAKQDGLKNIYIVTDDSCNYHVYESLECKRIYETIVRNKEKGKLGIVSTENAYVYSKKL